MYHFSWVNPKIKTKKTKEFGEGNFAAKGIKKGETLSIFGGYVLSRTQEDNLPCELRDYAIQISENHVIGVVNKHQIDDSCFFNHSCDPNTGIKGQIFLVAMRNIGIGEQVTFDYGMVLHNAKGVKKQYRLKCLCGSKNCRGVITTNDWKKKELQKKYNGFFQYYLQEKINRSKSK